MTHYDRIFLSAIVIILHCSTKLTAAQHSGFACCYANGRIEYTDTVGCVAESEAISPQTEEVIIYVCMYVCMWFYVYGYI